MPSSWPGIRNREEGARGSQTDGQPKGAATTWKMPETEIDLHQALKWACVRTLACLRVYSCVCVCVVTVCVCALNKQRKSDTRCGSDRGRARVRGSSSCMIPQGKLATSQSFSLSFSLSLPLREIVFVAFRKIHTPKLCHTRSARK